VGLPDYQSLMLPLLEFAGQNTEFTIPVAIKELAKFFNLTDRQMAIPLPSGGRTVFYDRVHWAIKYLKHAGLIQRIARGRYKITASGIKVLSKKPTKIDNNFLARYPSFLQYRR